jgi:predicted site-specific integrase-resolvase
LIGKRDHNRVNVVTSRADEHIVERSRAGWCHKAACRGMTKRVALYARVSVGNGAQTVENQLRDLQEVAVRLGWNRPELNCAAVFPFA